MTMWREIIRPDAHERTRQAVDTQAVRASIINLMRVVGASIEDDGDVFNLWDAAGRALMTQPGIDVEVMQAVTGLPKAKAAATRTLFDRLVAGWRRGNAYGTTLRTWTSYHQRFAKQIEPSWIESDGRLNRMNDDELRAYCAVVAADYGAVCAFQMRLTFMGTLAVHGLAMRIHQLNARLSLDNCIQWSDLVSGLGGLPIVQPVLDLWSLARAALTHYDVTDAIVTGEVAEIPARLQTTAIGTLFWQRVDQYIHRYRYWGSVVDDWAGTRWDEDSTVVFKVLRAYVQANAAFDPFLHVRTQQKKRDEATSHLKRMMWGGARRLWPFSGVVLIGMLERAQLYMRSITESWDVCARIGYYARRAYHEMEKREENNVRVLHKNRASASLDSHSQEGNSQFPAENARLPMDDFLLQLPLFNKVPIAESGRLGVRALAAAELGIPLLG